jgi:two-component system sensor histidine kinase VanS
MTTARVPRTGVRRRLTIHARLTLSYAGLITGSGAVLIALVYLYMRFVPSYQIVGAVDPATSADLAVGGAAQPRGGVAITSADDFLDNLLVASGAALLVLALIGAVVGWVVARRIIKPLSEIGAAARRAAAGSLDHRVGLDGPRDEIRDLADTFDQMLASLERSFAAQRRFAANASHELQTPLATTKTMIDVTLSDPDADSADLRGLVTRIQEVNQGSIETVDALLDLATAEHATVDCEPVDLAALAGTVVRELSDEARVAGVRIEGPTGEADALGSAVLIRQAVSNLVRNAIRHNQAGGHASVHVSSSPERARITISNGGPIVTADDIGVLIEPFGRARGRALTRGNGHGLGLAIASAAVEANRGVLTLTPHPDGGLTATVELPLARGDLGSGATARTPDPRR